MIYQQDCATESCHGVNGDGILSSDGFHSWPLVGEEFQHRNPTVQVILDVVRNGGEISLHALTDQQVYDAIAFEMSLHDVELSEMRDVQNAPLISSGKAAGVQKRGSLYPPPDNAGLISNWSAPGLLVLVEINNLCMHLTQIALVNDIRHTLLPFEESYVLVVFTLEVLTDHSLEVGPQNLRLVTEDGHMLEPLEIGLDYPVTRFYPHHIEPEHALVALAIFTLPETANIGYL